MVTPKVCTACSYLPSMFISDNYNYTMGTIPNSSAPQTPWWLIFIPAHYLHITHTKALLGWQENNGLYKNKSLCGILPNCTFFCVDNYSP